MVNKRIYQVILLLLLFLICITFYQIYFSEKKKNTQEKISTITIENNSQVEDSNETMSNVIQNLRYVSKD